MSNEELNLKVASALGCVPCDKWRYFHAGQSMKGNCGHKKCYSVERGPSPYASSAWALEEVKDYLKELGWGWAIRYIPKHRYRAEIMRLPANTRHFQLATTENIAFCYAFLKAVNHEKGQTGVSQSESD